ncbi:MAG: MoaD/ThiS family protein [Nocardioidaceae bacterium]|nr:MoaD/ThiS family protein [Nocardioidaceae bacterium]
MEQPLTDHDPRRPDNGLPLVTVRYWAAARVAAGVAEETLPGGNVAEVLAAAVRSRPDDLRFERMLSISSVLVGEVPLGARAGETVEVETGDVLEILPPFAGG